jgi:cell division protein FtsW (lipid II flippase)
MTALCAVMPLVGALATVRDVQKGWLGYGVAIVVGVVIGLFCAWAMRAVGTALATRSRPGSDRGWKFRLLYIGASVWIIFALFIGSCVAAALVRRI